MNSPQTRLNAEDERRERNFRLANRLDRICLIIFVLAALGILSAVVRTLGAY
ncbi:hypothetical protein [Tranquillimonas rosea]|uniref:hypothetical protein n=1 Tax=Tranquillimonas rosea TaxID=641238 RepID=UPI003BAD625E